MKVLLTGGTGFLGRRLAARLLEAGHSLRLLVRGDGIRSGLPEGVETVRGDVTDVASFRRAAEGCGAILHTAALVKAWVPDPGAFDAVNVGGVRHALEVARSTGARLVYTSSFMAIGPTGVEPVDESRLHPGTYRNHYERTKAQADAVARQAAAGGQDVVLLYPGVVYGPGELTDGNLVVRMLADHLNGRFPGYVGPGDRIWSYSFVDDVVAGHLAALEKGRGGERYFLCGENVSMMRLFALVEELAGVAPPKRHIPYAVAGLLGRALVFWADLTGLPPRLTHETVNVFREHWSYSSRRAEAELGYRTTPLVEGLRMTLEWLKAEGHVG
jgi:farnesol dehydrogenase